MISWISLWTPATPFPKNSDQCRSDPVHLGSRCSLLYRLRTPTVTHVPSTTIPSSPPLHRYPSIYPDPHHIFYQGYLLLLRHHLLSTCCLISMLPSQSPHPRSIVPFSHSSQYLNTHHPRTGQTPWLPPSFPISWLTYTHVRIDCGLWTILYIYSMGLCVHIHVA